MTRLLLALLLLSGPALAEPATVAYVVDGDTVAVRLGGTIQRVRIFGVDTPETGPRALCEAERQRGDAAKRAAKELLPAGTVVDLQRAPGHDKYGRLLARLTLPDGRDYGSIMLERGLARRYNGKRKESWCELKP